LVNKADHNSQGQITTGNVSLDVNGYI